MKRLALCLVIVGMWVSLSFAQGMQPVGGVTVASVPAGQSFTLSQQYYARGSASFTFQSAPSAGHLIVLYVATYGGTGTPSMTASSGTNPTAASQIMAFSAYRGQFFYVLSNDATGSPTYTYSLSGDPAVIVGIIGWDFACGQTPSLDVEATPAGGTSSVASISTSNFNTANAVELVVAGVTLMDSDTTNFTTGTINGNSTTKISNNVANNYCSGFHQVTSSNFTGGNATANFSPNTDYVGVNVIAFK